MVDHNAVHQFIYDVQYFLKKHLACLYVRCKFGCKACKVQVLKFQLKVWHTCPRVYTQNLQVSCKVVEAHSRTSQTRFTLQQ